jgi:hypothetical protein
MYLFGVLPPSSVAKAYAKDSVVFLFGVLALAAAISKTGLDRRIGILLLGTSTTLHRFGLILALAPRNASASKGNRSGMILLFKFRAFQGLPDLDSKPTLSLNRSESSRTYRGICRSAPCGRPDARDRLAADRQTIYSGVHAYQKPISDPS